MPSACTTPSRPHHRCKPGNRQGSCARRGSTGARHLKPRTRGAGCTLASLLYANGQVCAVNSGDARIWRLRARADGNGQWLQVSRDHTTWQQMLDDGDAQAGQTDEYASIY